MVPLRFKGVVTTRFTHGISTPCLVTVGADIHLIQCPRMGSISMRKVRTPLTPRDQIA